MKKRHVKICEKLGWTVCDSFSDGNIDLEKYSPAGEDFIFSASAMNFVSDVEHYAAYFDVNEHVEMWIPSRGKKGVPSSIRELIEDAEAIAKMLHELADALKNADEALKL